MSLLNSLHFKVASGVIGTVLAISAAYFVWDYRLYRAELLQEARDSADKVGRITLAGILELSMMGEHPEWVQGGIERLARDSESLRIDILNRNGRVRFSSERATIGRVLSRQDPGCRDCHGSDSASQQSRFLEISGRQVLRHARPIPNGPQCTRCHPAAGDSLGLLLVDFPTVEMDRKLHARITETLWKAGVMISAILLVLGILMNRLVIRRIQRLTRAVTAAGPTTGSASLAGLGGSDEIGQLGASFREMASSLQQRCAELEQKEKIRLALLERLVQSQEEDRRMLSLELHDELGQSLSALLLAFRAHFSERAGLGAQQDSGVLAAACEDIEDRIRNLVGEVHRLAWQMRPSVLDDFGLEDALRSYVQEISRASDLRLSYNQIPPDKLDRLPAWLEVTLYRIAQEAVNNVIKHARATHASLILIREPSAVTLLVEDNGTGFDPQEEVPRSEGGLGLLGMRERASLCGGSFEVESALHRGTTIRVKIPLSPGKNGHPNHHS